MYSNYELKHKALAALKGNWQTALMVSLIAALPSLISQVAAILTGTSYADTMNNLLLTMQQNPAASSADLMHSAGLTVQAYLPSALLSLVAALVSPFLTLGMINYTLGLLRGVKDAPITTVFSRCGSFFKAIGLNIMVYLRVFLWMLPGSAAMIGGMFIQVDWLAMIFIYGGMIAMLVLGFRASLHYAMALRFLADQPHLGVNQCIRESFRMMHHRKMLLFSLEISFMGWNILLMLLQTVVSSMLGNVLGSTVYMVLNLALTVYIQTASCAFYDAYLPRMNQPDEGPVNLGDLG